jgi:hypothetical protein
MRGQDPKQGRAGHSGGPNVCDSRASGSGSGVVVLVDTAPSVWNISGAQSARGRTDAQTGPTKLAMTYELKKNCRRGFARGRGSKADVAVPMWCGGVLTESDDCKYLIFRRLPPFFTVFHHISYHFSAISNWFLSGYKEVGVYLNPDVTQGELLPDFTAISGYLRLFPAKKNPKGRIGLALLRRLQPGGSGARLFAASLNWYNHS